MVVNTTLQNASASGLIPRHLKKKNCFNNFRTVKLSMDCCNNLQVAGSRAFTCPAPLFFSRWWPGNGLPLKKVLSTMPGDFTSVWYNWGQVLSQSLRTDYRGCLLQKQVKQRKKHCFHFTTVSDFPSCWRTFSSARLNCNLSHSFSLPRSRVGL